jgi:hypothetical protein
MLIWRTLNNAESLRYSVLEIIHSISTPIKLLPRMYLFVFHFSDRSHGRKRGPLNVCTLATRSGVAPEIIQVRSQILTK